jgi:hypothetical protein
MEKRRRDNPPTIDAVENCVFFLPRISIFLSELWTVSKDSHPQFLVFSLMQQPQIQQVQKRKNNRVTNKMKAGIRRIGDKKM